MADLPFDDSRRLTGPNLFFEGPGAVLETVAAEAGDGLIAGWAARVERAREHLRWPPLPVAHRRHARGVSLALAAPIDQLFTATELNEWAWCATLAAADPPRWAGLEQQLAASQPDVAIAAVLEEDAAFGRLTRLARDESRPLLHRLLNAAADRALPAFLDDASLTLGAGTGGRSFPLDALPAVERVDWRALHDIPTVLVTGSNGKTTTVRLLAACARARGWRTGHCCTDGVFVDDRTLESGDYSGPIGARTVLREPTVQAAILETARGGILRRGLALRHARTAVITNVSADHFGEYGIDDLESLADVKLVVAQALDRSGLLVLNADDELLLRKALEMIRRRTAPPALGWFAMDADHPVLCEHRARHGATCGVRDGALQLAYAGSTHDLGPLAAMPLAVAGHAAYNVANLAAAALAAASLGIRARTIAGVLARFGADPADNPGRLARVERAGVTVFVDYAHNPEGLRGVLELARRVDRTGRLALLLGQAGNRTEQDIRALATTAAAFQPDLVVLKDMAGYLRGRQAGEVPGILREALLDAGLPASALQLELDEVAAARRALDWARPGDVVVLLIHAPAARAAVLSLLGIAAAGPAV